jgi:hypothetical protein
MYKFMGRKPMLRNVDAVVMVTERARSAFIRLRFVWEGHVMKEARDRIVVCWGTTKSSRR